MAGDFGAMTLKSKATPSASHTDAPASERQAAWVSRVHSTAKPGELVETIRAFLDVSGIKDLWLIDLQSNSTNTSRWQGWHVGEGAIEIRPAFVQEALRRLATAEPQQNVDITLLTHYCIFNRDRLADHRARHSNGFECLMFACITQSTQQSELLVWAYTDPTNARGCNQHTLVIDQIARKMIALKEQATLPLLRSTLTNRERECIALTSYGYSEKQIAKELDISPYTVRVHIENLKKKLGARNKIHAVVLALSSHQINLEVKAVQNHGKVPKLLHDEEQDNSGGAGAVDIVFDCIDGRSAFKKDRLLQQASFRCSLDSERFIEIGRLS